VHEEISYILYKGSCVYCWVDVVDVLRTEDMTATQGFSSGRFGLRTRSTLRGGRRIGLFGMVGSRDEDCPMCRRREVA